MFPPLTSDAHFGPRAVRDGRCCHRPCPPRACVARMIDLSAGMGKECVQNYSEEIPAAARSLTFSRPSTSTQCLDREIPLLKLTLVQKSKCKMLPLTTARSASTLGSIGVPTVQGNHNLSSVAQCLLIPNMYMGTLDYPVLIILYICMARTSFMCKTRCCNLGFPFIVLESTTIQDTTEVPIPSWVKIPRAGRPSPINKCIS